MTNKWYAYVDSTLEKNKNTNILCMARKLTSSDTEKNTPNKHKCLHEQNLLKF